MFSRIRAIFGFALLLSLVTSVTVFAKGGFSFITISSPNLKNAVRVTDPALTKDFFAFADFYRGKTDVPANPGIDYAIIRYFIDNNRELAFDHFHYYPETGFVYYDGLLNGSSEYDSEWYTAKPEIKTAFESVLLNQTQSAPQISQSQPLTSLDSTQSFTLLAVIAGLVILGLAFWLRRPSTR